MPPTHPLLEHYAADLLGMLNGFARLRRRGTLRRIANVQGTVPRQFSFNSSSSRMDLSRRYVSVAYR